jgi:hypothetical protein
MRRCARWSLQRGRQQRLSSDAPASLDESVELSCRDHGGLSCLFTCIQILGPSRLDRYSKPRPLELAIQLQVGVEAAPNHLVKVAPPNHHPIHLVSRAVIDRPLCRRYREGVSCRPGAVAQIQNDHRDCKSVLAAVSTSATRRRRGSPTPARCRVRTANTALACAPGQQIPL